MKFNITLNNVKVSKDIPNAWFLVKFRHFMKLTTDEGISQIISVFTDIPRETIEKAEIKNFDVLISCLSFMRTEMNLITPDKILGYELPKDIGAEAAARYADLEELTKQFTEDKIANLSLYPKIVATYLAPSPYNFKEADQIAELLQDAPCTEVVAAGNFILIRHQRSKKPMLQIYHPVATRLSKFKRVTTNWLNRLVFTIRYTFWKRSPRSTEGNYSNGA